MKILFVCLGNICRSVMAEMILKSMLKKQNINNIYVSSAATSSEEVGNPIYPDALKILIDKGIEVDEHVSRQMTIEDYNTFDLIICMDNNNKMSILRLIGNDIDNKIHLLSEYTSCEKEIADPWYTRDFETAYKDIYEYCQELLKKII